MIKGQYDTDNSAAFHIHGERIDDSTLDMEVFCEGDFGIMCALIMDELAELIVRNSQDIEQMRSVSMDVRRMLTRYCNEKWSKKTGEPVHYAVADGVQIPTRID